MSKELLLFSATWCKPCSAFKPHFHDADKDYPDITFKVIDVDLPENRTLVRECKVRGVPTMVYRENGEQLRWVHGMTQREHITAMLEKKGV